MAEERVQRRLAAILAADVVGYTRMMSTDEPGTLARLKRLRSEIFDPNIDRFGGRIFKTTGDGALAEFGSAVDAVQCSVQIQRELDRRNAEAPEGQRMELRIGISLGDVVVDGGDLFGNGVNVAARMEGLAEPGGICVSGNVQEHIGNTLDVSLDDLGEQKVKNIDSPIRCYRILLHGDGRETAKTLAIPDKPSIAVLPFDNLSGDAEQEYFADGVAEDIITALSRFHWFFVIARNSSFSYKGTSPDVRTVARDLGVQYVLEGSVRRAADRVRISAQLVDALSGRHIWAERFDRDLSDIFALQDEIAEAIAGAVAPSFISAEARRVERKAPENLDAWDFAIHGNWHLWHLDKAHLEEAGNLFQSAVDLDPDNVLALSGLALVNSWEVVWGWAEEPDAQKELADRASQRAVAADPNDAWAYAVLSTVHVHRRRLDDAARAARTALDLNPNLAFGEFALASALAWSGDFDGAMEHIDKAERLSPRDPAHAWFTLQRAVAAFVVGRYEDQVAWAEQMTKASPNHPAGWRLLAAGCGLLGQQAKAEEACRGLLRVVPHYTLALAESSTTGIRREDLDRLLEGLRKAGVPEKAPPSGSDHSIADRPSIAVLPFENMSGDPDQEYFADGITEDIITALYRVRWFRVVSRNSTFAFKGQSPDIRDVADALGVRYVIEGSVRKAGSRIRLTAQLIDGAAGDHLWAERYDRDLEDIFDLQDELTQTIVGAIEPELGRAERDRSRRVRSENLQAWDTFQRAMWHYHRRSKQDYAEAERLFRQAIEQDQNLTRAYSGLAQCLSMSAILGHAESPRSHFDEAVELARRAIEIDPQDPDARIALCRAYTLSRQPEKAIVEAEAAIRLDPNSAAAHYHLGAPLVTLGRCEEGIEHLELAIRLSPNDPLLGHFYARMAQAHLYLENYEAAANWADKALAQPGVVWPMAMFKASALGHMGHTEKALEAVDEIYRYYPEFDEQKVREIFTIGDPQKFDHVFDGLRKAGWIG